jgi:hypothetical protein
MRSHGSLAVGFRLAAARHKSSARNPLFDFVACRPSSSNCSYDGAVGGAESDAFGATAQALSHAADIVMQASLLPFATRVVAAREFRAATDTNDRRSGTQKSSLVIAFY